MGHNEIQLHYCQVQPFKFLPFARIRKWVYQLIDQPFTIQ